VFLFRANLLASTNYLGVESIQYTAAISTFKVAGHDGNDRFHFDDVTAGVQVGVNGNAGSDM
jgi:hypothetical protein